MAGTPRASTEVFVTGNHRARFLSSSLRFSILRNARPNFSYFEKSSNEDIEFDRVRKIETHETIVSP